MLFQPDGKSVLGAHFEGFPQRRYLKADAFVLLQESHEHKEIAGSRIAFGAKHAHQASVFFPRHTRELFCQPCTLVHILISLEGS